MNSNVSFQWETNDRYSMFAQKWLPDRNPKAIIVIVHGLGEHSSRYNHMAKFFNERGLAVYAFDQRGHGKSSGLRGDIPSYNHACDDIDSLIGFARKEFPGIPVFLYGHSLGGAIVLYYGINRSAPIQGIICTSPGLATGAPQPPIKVSLARILASIAPKLAIDNGLDVENLSHNRDVINAYKQDPLVHPKISARLAMELIGKGSWMIENASKFKYPLLLMQGGMDHLVSPDATEKFSKAFTNGNMIFKQFPDLYHEMHNEPENKVFLNEIVSWLDKQLERV